MLRNFLLCSLPEFANFLLVSVRVAKVIILDSMFLILQFPTTMKLDVHLPVSSASSSAKLSASFSLLRVSHERDCLAKEKLNKCIRFEILTNISSNLKEEQPVLSPLIEWVRFSIAIVTNKNF